MSRILLLGSGGRLGSALAEAYAAEHIVTRLNRQALDFSDPAQIAARLENLTFDTAINCAALTNVDYCESHREEAFAINAGAVRAIAESCAQKSARLIHVSTDYVWNGEQQAPYHEDDPAEPISVYGESKLAGEKAALEVSDQNLVVRVSWVFGPHRPSFVDSMLRKALTEKHISAVADKFSTPSYTLDLAAMLEPYLETIPAGGVLHLCNDGACSWQEYAQHALDVGHVAGLPLLATTVDPVPLDSLQAFVARRPRHTVMSTNRYTAETGRPPRHWKEAVADYVRTFGQKIIA